jgi:hypothetical protein
MCDARSDIQNIDHYHSSDPFSCSRVVVVVVVVAKWTCNFVLMLMMMTKHHLVLVLFFWCSSSSSSSPGFSLSFPALPHEVGKKKKDGRPYLHTLTFCVCLGFNYHDALRRLSNALLLFVSWERKSKTRRSSPLLPAPFQPLRAFFFTF